MGHHRLTSPDMERIFQGETVSGLSEWQLLARYLEHRDELAFAALVARHGPMVMGTCRRMLAGSGEAEDAFQATFMVLVRRARSLGPRDAIGPWLHGVAARVSMRARSKAARRRRVEPSGGELTGIPDGATPMDAELAAIIDQEVNRLPAKYKLPIVLCYLQGLTHEDAARHLKWPLGSVKGRLARARDLLRSRLLRRGIAPAAALLGGSIAREASAAVDREILEQTVINCMKVTLGQASIDAVSISIASLVKGALSAMIFEKLKWTGIAILASGLALAGAVVMARQPGGSFGGGGFGGDRAAKRSRAIVNDRRAPAPAATIVPGENAKEAVTVSPEVEDLRKQLIQAAKREWTTAIEDLRANRTTLDRIYQSSRRLLNAEQDGQNPVFSQAAASEHANRMREVARTLNANHPSHTDSQVAQVQVYSAEAELWAAQASAKVAAAAKAVSASSPAAASRGKDSGESGTAEAASRDGLRWGQDPRSRQIIARLEELVPMKFLEETPLENVLKHIRDSTKSPEMPAGIPIYIDPIRLSEADKTMASTIRNIDLEGVPLRRTLQLVLTQLDLCYFVVDGMLYISSLESADFLPPVMPLSTPLTEKLDKAERGELTMEEMTSLIAILKAQQEIEGIRPGPNHDVIVGGPPPAPTEDVKQHKELVESLSKLTQSLLEELKELRKAKQPETAPKPTTPVAVPNRNLQ
jgi:RNA polymerase sigma factor (sigma-70 family)